MVWDIPKADIGLLPIENIYYEDTKSKTISKTKPTPNAVISEPTMNDLLFLRTDQRIVWVREIMQIMMSTLNECCILNSAIRLCPLRKNCNERIECAYKPQPKYALS